DHDCDEDCPEAHHDVVAVIKQRNIIRPVLPGKIIESPHVRVPTPVSQHTEHARYGQRIIDLALLVVRLSHDYDRRSTLAMEQSFHGGERDRLIRRNHLAVAVARRIELKNAEQTTRNHADLKKNTGMLGE